MESIIALGVSWTSLPLLRITSDPKERRAAAIFSATFGLACLLVILLAPFSRLGWAGLIVFGCVGAGCLLFAFLVGLCRTEIEFDVAQGQIVRRRFCMGRVRSVSALPLDRLKTIKVVETGKGTGELQLIRTEEKCGRGGSFEPLAEETRREILAWLRERSVLRPQMDMGVFQMG